MTSLANMSDIEQSIRDCDEMTAAVRSAPPERFDMERQFCDTAGCVAGWTWHRSGSGAGLETFVHRLLPALDGCGVWWEGRDTSYIFHYRDWFRNSAIDDAPFAPTPEEVAVMGEDWARGMSEREAALARIQIVRACLVKWRAALAPNLVYSTTGEKK